MLALGLHAGLRDLLSRVSASRAWGIAFLAVLFGGAGALAWLTFWPPPWADFGLFARAGGAWIVLLTVTALGHGARPR